MLGRLFKGLILGLLLGGLGAGLLVKGLGVTVFAATGAGAFLAFAAAAVTGVAVGLVAGKPIWAAGAWIEALLKAFFGALIAAGAMFLLRKFVNVDLNLDNFGLGSGNVADLPVLAMPAIATLLSVFYEADNTDAPEAAAKGGRVAGKAPDKKLRAPSPSGAKGLDDDDEAAVAPRKAKK